MTKITRRKIKNRQTTRRYPLNQSAFYKLTTKKRLAELLGMNPAELRALVKRIRYNQFYETNENGKKRLIESPCRPLKIAQKKIAKQLSRIEPPNYLQCPVKGRSYVTNALEHYGAKVIRTLDVRKYFPSTSEGKVFRFWRNTMRCNSDVAAVLTKISVFNGHLPTGSPLSPILAFFANMELWEQLDKISTGHNCRITVYVDDITVSGEIVTGELMWKIKKEIKRAGLNYHKEKNFWNGNGEITGIIISRDNVQVPRRQLLKIHKQRKALRAAKNEHDFKAVQCKLKGLLEQSKQVGAISKPRLSG